MPVIKQETITINDYGSTKGNVRQRYNQSAKTGKITMKERFTIDMRAEPMVHVFDDVALGRGVANAIRDKLERDIKAIGADAATRTKEFRAYAANRLEGKVGTKRLKSGKRKRTLFKHVPKSLKQRYDGGRTGYKPPAQTEKLFNDSGRLAEGVHVRQNGRQANDPGGTASREIYWTVNVPVNRFTEHTRHLFPQLADLVSSIKHPRELVFDPTVNKEIQQSLDLIIAKAKNQADAKRKALKLARLNALKAAFDLARALAG